MVTIVRYIDLQGRDLPKLPFCPGAGARPPPEVSQRCTLYKYIYIYIYLDLAGPRQEHEHGLVALRPAAAAAAAAADAGEAEGGGQAAGADEPDHQVPYLRERERGNDGERWRDGDGE